MGTNENSSLQHELKLSEGSDFNKESALGNIDKWSADVYLKEKDFICSEESNAIGILKPRPGERILDLGCGSGEVTLDLKKAGNEVVGVDASALMVESAKAKGLDARVYDGHDLDFQEEFDAVFSNRAMQWMYKDPRKIVRNIFNALKKGGRFVGEFAGEGAWDSVVKPLKSALERRGLSSALPVYHPSKEEYAALLKSEGFEVQHITLLPRVRLIKGGVRMWAEIIVPRLVSDIDDATMKQIYDEIEEAVGNDKTDADGCFPSDLMVMTVFATKP